MAVREYGFLASGTASGDLDLQYLHNADFEHLKRLALAADASMEFLRLTARKGAEVLQVQNYVGVLSLPSGEQLEIVPKTTLGRESIADGRRVLLKMLAAVFELEFFEAELADLEALKRPWLEALIGHVLKKTAGAIRPGLCRRYRRTSNEGPFLKGQLQVVLQLRQRVGRAHQFHMRHDVYSANRPENRLLRSALERLARWSSDARNQRLCRELLFVMNEVPSSSDFASDLQAWNVARDTARYTPLLPWLRLILSFRSPLFASGPDAGVALLFPMEALFERYVAKQLRRQISRPFFLKQQARSESLVEHMGDPWFQLKPDLLVTGPQGAASVLDTKWKLLDGRLANASAKYGLSQADFYQLFAYGEKYLGGVGEMFLIYPQHSAFLEPLPSFAFNEKLRLWAVPFDMRSDAIRWPHATALPWWRRGVAHGGDLVADWIVAERIGWPSKSSPLDTAGVCE